MKKAKKSILTILMAVFMVSMFLPFTNASARASEYINETYTYLYAGEGSGELDVEFFIHATKTPTLLGVNKIKFYKSNGDYVTTVWGTVIDGLLSNDGSRFYGNTYTFDRAESGVSYYAVVTFMAKDSNGGDTFEMETNVVKAP